MVLWAHASDSTRVSLLITLLNDSVDRNRDSGTRQQLTRDSLNVALRRFQQSVPLLFYIPFTASTSPQLLCPFGSRADFTLYLVLIYVRLL